jgi:myo-inositol catabolism protein IolS
MNNSSITFPPLALGTWTFAGDAIWSETSERESIRVIHAAIDKGITLFDTSPNYGSGRSEAILGKAIADRPEAVLASKIVINDQTVEIMRSTIEKSLVQLNRETINLMQIHWPGNTPDETLQALELLTAMKKEGKILNIGVCNFGIFDLEETKEYPIISNQLPYNLLWRVVEEEIAPLSKTLGKAVWAYSPLQQGLLTGRYTKLNDFPEGRQRSRHFSTDRAAAYHGGPGMERETEQAIAGFLEIAREVEIHPTELGLRYILSHSCIDTVLAGARTIKQLDELVLSINGPLDDEIITRLDAVSDPVLQAAGGNPDMFQKNPRVRYTPI